MAKTISAKLDEEEKKIIDLIRQHKLDIIDVEYLFKWGAKWYVNMIGEKKDLTPSAQRDYDKCTKLLEHLEKGE